MLEEFLLRGGGEEEDSRSLFCTIQKLSRRQKLLKEKIEERRNFPISEFHRHLHLKVVKFGLKCFCINTDSMSLVELQKVSASTNLK